MRALLDEQAVFHDEDEVGVDDRLQLVRHHHGGHVLARGVDHLDHRALDERVERARRLVAQQQPRPLEQRARHGDALPLAARERLAALADARVEAAGGALRPRGEAHLLGRLEHALAARREVAVLDVVQERVVEEHGLLRHERELLAQRADRDLAQVLSVERDRAAVGVVGAQDELEHRALARAARADDGRLRARGELEGDTAYALRRGGVVAEGDVLEAQRAAVGEPERRRVRRRDDLRHAAEQLQQLAQIGERLADLLVGEAEGAEWRVQLEQQAVHRRHVADGEHAAERAARAHGEGAAEAGAEEERLAEVERRDDGHVVDAEPLGLPEEAVVLLDLVPARRRQPSGSGELARAEAPPPSRASTRWWRTLWWRTLAAAP